MLAYVDSSVWITYVEGDHPKQKETVEQYLDTFLQNDWRFCISYAVLLEVFYKPYRLKQTEWINGYTELFTHTDILPDYRNLLRDSLDVMKTENLKAMDAIHVALAKHHRCDGFVTTDPHFKYLTSIRPLWIDLAAV